MINNLIICGLVLAIVLPIGAFFLTEGKLLAHKRQIRFKHTLAVNVVSFFSMLVFATVFIFSSGVQAADAAVAAVGITDVGMKYLSAALATSASTIAAGMATGKAASAALGALSENDSLMGRALIFVALAEGVAIYGLLISFMILGN